MDLVRDGLARKKRGGDGDNFACASGDAATTCGSVGVEGFDFAGDPGGC